MNTTRRLSLALLLTLLSTHTHALSETTVPIDGFDEILSTNDPTMPIIAATNTPTAFKPPMMATVTTPFTTDDDVPLVTMTEQEPTPSAAPLPKPTVAIVPPGPKPPVAIPATMDPVDPVITAKPFVPLPPVQLPVVTDDPAPLPVVTDVPAILPAVTNGSAILPGVTDGPVTLPVVTDGPAPLPVETSETVDTMDTVTSAVPTPFDAPKSLAITPEPMAVTPAPMEPLPTADDVLAVPTPVSAEDLPVATAVPEVFPTDDPASDTDSAFVADSTPTASEEDPAPISTSDDALPGVTDEEADSAADPSIPPFLDAAEPSPESTDGPACFPADSVVTLANGQNIPMKDLQVGDSVMTTSGKSSDVFMFTHRMEKYLSTFVQLTTNNGNVITLSSGHRLAVDDSLVPARSAQVGGVVKLVNGESATIISKKNVQAEGLYNPQTVSGEIAVNGVVASTFTDALPVTCAHASLAPFRGLYQWFHASLNVFENGVVGASTVQKMFRQTV